MDFSHNGKKMGFVLANIHSGSSMRLWYEAAKEAGRDDCSFFIFPIGKLESETETLRSKISSLINSENVDGVISWSSSMGSSVSMETLEGFHDAFGSLPLVTIGQKIRNHPCIRFDAYTGMKDLVLHLIKIHGARRIVFVRGPENHASATDRFNAYKDALKENGLDYQGHEKYISDCFSWFDGEKAIIQICDERGLVPGKDFDAVVASSDLMAFEIVKFLKSRGYRIPKDVIVTGFNDTVESKISQPSLSTVHMPHAELGAESVRMLQTLLGNNGSVRDTILQAYPVVRETCGCGNLKSWVSPQEAKVKVKSRQQFFDEICKILKLTTEEQKGRLSEILDALFENDRGKFTDLVSLSVDKYLHNSRELSKLFSVITLFKHALCFAPDYIEKISRYVNVIIAQTQERVAYQRSYEIDKQYSVLRKFKQELLSVHYKKDFMSAIKNNLVHLGITSLAIVMADDENFSRYLTGYNEKDDVHFEEMKFSSSQLVPEKYRSAFEKGVFIVQPLFTDDKYYGYMVTNYSGCEGFVYEDIRSSISNALQSVMMFEEISKARQIAEKAEFEKTEFFANVGSDLCDPLKDLSAKIAQMESNVSNGVLDSDILSEQLLFLRSQIESQLEKTETLVDLTRSQVDDLPMDKKLFDIRQVLPVSVASSVETEMPLLYGDSDRLKKALQNIFDFTEKTPYIVEKKDGIHIEFYSSRFDWSRPELQLAEKIILLQYGSVEKSENYVEVVLTWPNLAGLPSESLEGDDVKVFCLSENSSGKAPFAVQMEKFSEYNSHDDSVKNLCMLYWEPDEAPIDEWVKVYGLRKDSTLFRVPLICYSRRLIGHTFLEMLEQKVKSQKIDSVLFVNAKHTHYGTWATDSNTVCISSISELDKILEEITPSLIVFESIDEVSIKKIRQNQKTVLVPILVLPDSIVSDEEVELLCSHPRIVLCNRGAAESEQFDARIKAILAGDEILPPHTGALVKKAILYLNKNASQQIVRWKLADTVHVSEDYLTRIFHKEIGLSLWEYLNRYRIYIATKMLLETNDTIYEIAENSGFQDQAYFCRVFKKIYGVPPGKIRTK